ncbi:hypothetical protein L207DRAFT_513332 [Hyaloscypha variabilis F]|uniref:Uncharacterized protein n=1 Tax=Hyaloscypha variabilis (strain UAMH 11265 / GT02V1 / F) TaxID=1149755 RepID=A0A2J6RK07_HYAVF|nr:hypothetical protein L207DRAFT_513332 [Hyaloscypha variabilis F]
MTTLFLKPGLRVSYFEACRTCGSIFPRSQDEKSSNAMGCRSLGKEFGELGRCGSWEARGCMTACFGG